MRFPIAGLIMLAIAGILLFMFVMFNYAFHSEGGLVSTLNETASKTMDADKFDLFQEQQDELSQMFGIGCVLCFFLAIAFFVMDVLGDKRGGEY